MVDPAIIGARAALDLDQTIPAIVDLRMVDRPGFSPSLPCRDRPRKTEGASKGESSAELSNPG